MCQDKKKLEIVEAIIEISSDSGPVKYEFEKATNQIRVDRFIPGSMRYPANYGYVPETLYEDGDPLDILVYTPYPIIPNSRITCRILGLLRMRDEAGNDDKLISVPTSEVCPQYSHIKELEDIGSYNLEVIKHFFKYYKEIEKRKWTEVNRWEGLDSALKVLKNSMKSVK